MCCLVATKSHAQFENALREVRESLDKFGLCQPVVFYTDNVQGDRQFLMDIFPSLCAGVEAREKYEHLPAFTVPPTTTVTVRDTVASINQGMQAIMDDLLDDGSGTLTVGLDCEWNVHFGPGSRERIESRGSVAVVQIAYKDTIYILRVSLSQIYLGQGELMLFHPHRFSIC